MKTLKLSLGILANILLTFTLYLLFMTPVVLYQQNYSIITAPFTKAFFDEKTLMIYIGLLFTWWSATFLQAILYNIFFNKSKWKKKETKDASLKENIKWELENDSKEECGPTMFLAIVSLGLFAFFAPRLVAFDMATPTSELNTTQIEIRRNYLADKHKEVTQKEKNIEEIEQLLTKLEDKNITVEKREELLKRLAALGVE